jgi:hypothetical protein
VRIALLSILGSMIWMQEAAAGRTTFGWLYDTEVVPERAVEVESWLQEENDVGPDGIDQTLWLWSAVVGVTDQVELSLPVEIVWERSDVMPEATTALARYGIEGKWRLVSSDPVDAPPVAGLLRVAAKRITARRDAARIEADLVASYDSGRIHAVVDAGIVSTIGRGGDAYEVRPGAGVSVRVAGDLRLGVEAFSMIKLRGGGPDWAAVGPSIGWTHGRFWLSGSVLIGVYQIDSAPRLNWGIAF